MSRLLSPARRVWRLAWRGDAVEAGERAVPEEVAVALSYDGSTHAVLMATPRDLEDFAVGFSLTERIVSDPAEICLLYTSPSPRDS